MGPIRRRFGTRPLLGSPGATNRRRPASMPQLTLKQADLGAAILAVHHPAPPRLIHPATHLRR